MNRRRAIASHRRGFVLPIVLAVLVLLTLAVYQLAERSVTDRLVSRSLVERKKAELAARSAADWVLAAAHADAAVSATTFDGDAARFTLPDDTRITLLRIATDGSGPQLGVASEGGKMNPNAFATVDDVNEDFGELLATFAGNGLTADVGDLIADIVDADSTVRPLGDESGLSGAPLRNVPLDSLDDLLAVPGITEAMVYGEDANRNGLLDENENDGDATAPPDNADGLLDFGLGEFLTVSSRVANLQPDGSPKINLNGDSLSQLQADLTGLGILSEKQVDFVVRVRRDGFPGDDVNAGGNRPAEPRGGEAADRDDTAEAGDDTPSYRLGMIGELLQDGYATSPFTFPIIDSPFADDLPSLSLLYQHAALSDVATEPGRIDLNAVNVDALGRILEDSALAATVLARRDYRSVLEPLIDGAMEVDTLGYFELFHTVNTRTFRFQAIGYRPGGQAVRYEFVVDAADPGEPRILQQHDLSRLGIAIDPAIYTAPEE